MGEYAPPAPPFVQPPLLWGTENHVRHIFAGTGVTLEFARESVPPPPFDTPGEAVDWNAERFGPLLMLRGLLEQQGRWEEARAKMISIYGSGAPAEYLVVQGRKGRLSDQCIFGPRCGPTFRRSTLAAMTRPTPWDPSRERRRCHWHDAAQMAVVWPRCGPVEGVGRGRANGAGGH
jgi:hypothetical protein